MLYVLVLLVLSAIMAAILQYAFKKIELPWGYWNRLIGSVIGALAGELLLSRIGEWGWILAGFNVIAGVIGAFVIGSLYIFIVNKYFLKSSKGESKVESKEETKEKNKEGAKEESKDEDKDETKEESKEK
ncbi:MAG: hypothetical protein GX175_01445 [Halanaerobiaceae bacterium]|jgi:phosphate/sulfate permease|nr:hypothetical protein [Halanaerobiaceae bacterium]